LKLVKQSVSRQQSRASLEVRTNRITRRPVKSKGRHLSQPVRPLELYGFKFAPIRQEPLLSLKLTALLNAPNKVVRMCPLPRKRSTPARI
jgi:hypothetical protein